MCIVYPRRIIVVEKNTKEFTYSSIKIEPSFGVLKAFKTTEGNIFLMTRDKSYIYKDGRDIKFGNKFIEFDGTSFKPVELLENTMQVTMADKVSLIDEEIFVSVTSSNRMHIHRNITKENDSFNSEQSIFLYIVPRVKKVRVSRHASFIGVLFEDGHFRLYSLTDYSGLYSEDDWCKEKSVMDILKNPAFSDFLFSDDQSILFLICMSGDLISCNRQGVCAYFNKPKRTSVTYACKGTAVDSSEVIIHNCGSYMPLIQLADYRTWNDSVRFDPSDYCPYYGLKPKYPGIELVEDKSENEDDLEESDEESEEVQRDSGNRARISVVSEKNGKKPRDLSPTYMPFEDETSDSTNNNNNKNQPPLREKKKNSKRGHDELDDYDE